MCSRPHFHIIIACVTIAFLFEGSASSPASGDSGSGSGMVEGSSMLNETRNISGTCQLDFTNILSQYSILPLSLPMSSCKLSNSSSYRQWQLACIWR